MKKQLEFVEGNSTLFFDLTTITFSAQRLVERYLERNVTFAYWTRRVIRENDTQFTGFSNFALSGLYEIPHRAVDAWDLFEELVSSPEFPVSMINHEGKPVYRTANDRMKKRSQRFAEIMEGELLFVKTFYSYFGNSL